MEGIGQLLSISSVILCRLRTQLPLNSTCFRVLLLRRANGHIKEYRNPNMVPSPEDSNYRLRLTHETADAISQLHNLCSDIHRMFEHLADLEERGKFLKYTYRRYVDAIHENNKYKDRKWPLDKPHSVEDSVKHLISGVNTCKRWAVNYNNRTHLYENMLYHTAAQEDNRMNGENAKTSIQITKLTKDDNKSFVALSVLAMLFLPGTFVAILETRGPLFEPC